MSRICEKMSLQRIFTIIIMVFTLFVDLSRGSPNFRSIIAGTRADNLNYRLPESVLPEHYTLKISPQFNNNTFGGYVKILIHVNVPTNNITLHQNGLNITKEKIYLTTKDDLVINIRDAGDTGTEEQEFYTITFPRMLEKKTYYLHIPEFYGVLNKDNVGFHYADYIDENGKLCVFAMTKFESTTARYAFPCFDEPALRAKFKIYIVRPSNYHSMSNTKLIKSVALSNGLYEDEFEVTVSMSTYLVAFIVSQMKLSTNPDTSFHQILARPEVVKNKYEQYSLKLSVKILQTVENYFNVNYSLNKMDQVAVPDRYSSSGAVENWGLVAYKETSLLLTPRTTTRMQMYIDTVITHEFVHQWMGNLVAISWWKYLWLKEGFAKFLESRIIDMIKPEWRKMELFIIMEKHGILETDSSINTRDMNQDAGTPLETQELYDVIAYRKAACVLHMLETVMTPNIFRHGLTNFLQDRAYQSAVPNDLYRNLQRALDNSAVKLPNNLNIHKIMTTWDSRKGYPLVNVTRNYDKNENIVKLTQCRYFNIKKFISQSHWYIPINYATRSNPNFNNTQFSDWLLKSNAEITIKNLNRGDWLILNKQEAYYYRVNYDARNWNLITLALLENHRDIHILNKAQMIDDSFNLAKTGILDFSVPLRISSYLDQEDEYIVQYPFLRHMDYIAGILHGSDVESKFKSYVINILKRSYRRLGNNLGPGDTEIDKLQRIQVVRWMCKFNFSNCRNITWNTFNLWIKNNKKLPVDLEEEIMCNAIRHGNKEEWNYLIKRYQESINDDFEKHAFRSLGCSEDVSLLMGFMNSSLNPSSKYSIVDVVKVISKNGLVGLQVSKNYVIDHFNSLLTILGNKNMSTLLTNITSCFTNEGELKNFIRLLQKVKRVDKQFIVTLNDARLGISSKEEHRLQVTNFFRKFQSDQKSGGNLCLITLNIYVFILYNLIVTILY